MCGEKLYTPCVIAPSVGSPPRMRGKAAPSRPVRQSSRITPAYAGKRTALQLYAIASKDHPRMCGEKELAQYVPVQYVGSPPHVRGKVPSICENLERMGITPACAGKSRIRAGRGAAFGDHPPPAYAGKSKIRRKGRWQHRDHPRVCGEKTQIGQVVHPDWGSPPRMRGKEVGVSGDGLQLGITPAYAGKSPTAKQRGILRRDHPRVCGEKPVSMYTVLF